MLHAYVIVVAGVFGLLIGSFLNAWAYRLPLGISVADGRSFCPACTTQIRAVDNVPLVSWLAAARALPRLRSADQLALPARRGA